VGDRGLRRVRDLHRDQIERAVGERAGLVDAYRVDRGEGLGGGHLLDQRVHASQAYSCHRQRDAHQQHEALRDQRDQPGRRGLGGIVKGNASDREGQ
jgi:hypothetical protein